MSASFRPELFEELPIVGILRDFTTEQVAGVVRAALRGGLRNLEITMNTPDAARQIGESVTQVAGRMNIGAGTVTDRRLLDRALSAGASFIVTPTIGREIIAECVTQKIPVFPGAFSPTEVLAAWEAGATMVKIFPAETLGPGYIRSLKAPLPNLKLLPTGGVDLPTLTAFFQAGADGFGIGGPLFDRARIEAGDWAWIEARCRAFAEAWRALAKKD